MPDDALLNKSTIVERCLLRVRQVYQSGGAAFISDIDRQDIVVLNLLRACEACLDMGHRIIYLRRLGVPQSSRDVFMLLAKNGVIPDALGQTMQRMVGFRNVAVHEYQKIHLPVIVHIIETQLDILSEYCRIFLNAGAVGSFDS